MWRAVSGLILFLVLNACTTIDGPTPTVAPFDQQKYVRSIMRKFLQCEAHKEEIARICRESTFALHRNSDQATFSNAEAECFSGRHFDDIKCDQEF
jgi:hypothetical protein